VLIDQVGDLVDCAEQWPESPNRRSSIAKRNMPSGVAALDRDLTGHTVATPQSLWEA
jgi:hypothetical protein